MPVSLVVPGSEIPFTHSGDKDKATLDIIGVVRDELKRPVGNVRDTVKLNLDESQQVRRKNVQYQTGFTLPPGKFHLKFVLRENQSGRVGSFETDVVIPDYKREKAPLRLSSVIVGTQIQNAGKHRSDNVLAKDGAELIPNVLHVFSPGQHLYFYYEVYDPAKDSHEKSKQDPAADQHSVLPGQGEDLRDAAGGSAPAQRAQAQSRGLPVERPAQPVEAGPLHLPGDSDRRCGGHLRVSQAGAAGEGGSGENGEGGMILSC